MTEASETIARQVRNAVRETVSARRIQGAAGGGWTEKGIDQILFRGSHDIMRPLASYPSPVVHALMPSVVRFMLQAFLEIDATEAAIAGGNTPVRPRPSNAVRSGGRRAEDGAPGRHHPRTRREGPRVGGRTRIGT